MYNITTIIVCLLLGFNVLLAQPNDSKRDNTWLIGYGGDYIADTSGDFGNISMRFTDTNTIFSVLDANINYNETCAGISDTSGKMLFYTNGVIIIDSTYQIMQNSENFNESSNTTYWEETDDGLRLPQGALVLPMPNNPNKYYIFYEAAYFVSIGVVPLHLRYSVVDMELNNGLGAITEKKQDIAIDSLAFNGLTACRHANGRDWWVIMPQLSGYAYYLFLLTPQGVQDMSMQFIGDYVGPEFGQSVFTPDGRHYIRFHAGGDSPKCPLDIYDFDRCTGELSNFKRVWINQIAPIAGLAVSSNSRFAYCFTGAALHQYDMELDSTTHIADYDGFADPPGTVLAATLYQAQLAPNGKIYACSGNGVRYFHVVNNPNEAGLACNFVQHGVPLPVFNGFTIPNFPYFRLGREEGSGCDTLFTGVSNTFPSLQHVFELSPNPAQNYLAVKNQSQEKNATFVLYDITGRAVLQQTLSTQNTISTEHLPSGIYLYQIINPQNQSLQYGKVSIVR